MKKPLNEISNSAFYARFNGWFETSSAIGLHLSNKRNISSVSKNLRFLQRGLTGNRGLIASSYMDEWSILQPYLLYYWPISFYEVSAILYELKTRAVLPDINSVLDLGSGPGPASFAAQTFGAMRASLVDKSKRALAMASAIAAKGRRKNLNLEIIEYCASIEDFCAPKGESYDLIIAANSLNELWADSPDGILRRRDLVLRFLPNLQPEGILIIVEPSAHYTSIPLLELRDSLLAADLDGISLACVGPCLHSFQCPMLSKEKKPCFSEWQWNLPPLVRELADCAGLDRDSLKASWIALKKHEKQEKDKEALPDNETSSLDSSSADSLYSAADLGDSGDLFGFRGLRGRIVSEPMLNKAGRVRYIVCTNSALRVTISALRYDPTAENLGFFGLGRGDLIAANGLEIRGESHFGIAPCSQLEVLMRAPRI
ncbi:MAG TPA: small ribosomal subunit Rsm22 family protein [Rectinema sp.]|nr:small ribosomal subunit Rsm22 family protein [Rectinema sp.]